MCLLLKGTVLVRAPIVIFRDAAYWCMQSQSQVCRSQAVLVASGLLSVAVGAWSENAGLLGEPVTAFLMFFETSW